MKQNEKIHPALLFMDRIKPFTESINNYCQMILSNMEADEAGVMMNNETERLRLVRVQTNKIREYLDKIDEFSNEIEHFIAQYNSDMDRQDKSNS